MTVCWYICYSRSQNLANIKFYQSLSTFTKSGVNVRIMKKYRAFWTLTS